MKKQKNKIDELEIENRELKERIEKLENRLNNYKYMADSIPSIVFRIDLAGKFKYINKAGTELFGINEGILISDISISEFIDNEEFDMDSVQEYSDSKHMECFLFDKNKNRMPVSIFFSSYYVNNTINGYSGVMIDTSKIREFDLLRNFQYDIVANIRDQKNLEDTLNSIFDTLINYTDYDSGGIYLFDGKTGNLNLKMHKGIGAELITNVECYPPDDFRSKLVLKGESVFMSADDFEEPIKTDLKLGGIKSLAVLPIKYKNTVLGSFNLASHTIGIVSDETKEIIHEINNNHIGSIISQSIHESNYIETEVKLEAILSAIPDSIIILSPNGTVLENYSQDIGNYKGLDLPLFKPGFGLERILSDINTNIFLENIKIAYKTRGIRVFEFEITNGNNTFYFDVRIVVIDDNRILSIIRNITNIIAVLNALTESESKFRKYIENSPVGMVVFNKDGDFIEMNEAMRLLIKDNIDSDNINLLQALLSPEYFHLGLNYLEELKSKGISRGEVLIRDSENNNKYLSFEAARLVEDKFIAFCLDITDKKYSQQQIIKREQWLQSIFSAAPVGIAIIRDSKVNEINNMFSELTGYCKDEILNKQLNMFYNNEDEYSEFISNFKSQGIKSIETKWQRKDKSPIDILFNYEYIDPADTDKGITTTILDISASKAAEMALRDSEEKFRSIFEQLSLGITISDESSFILEANRKICEICEIEYNSIIGSSYRNFYRDDDIKRFDNLVDMLFKSKLDVIDIEGEFLTAKGKSIVLHNINSLFKRSDGSLYMVTIIEDVTERRQNEKVQKEMEKQLVQVQKLEAVGSLATGIAHDFNNILQTISLASEIAMLHNKEKLVGNKLQLIADSVSKAGDLIRQILFFSKSGQIETEMYTNNINKILKQTIHILKNTIPNSIDIRYGNTASAALVECDPTQIQQVIMNLGTNAFHAIEGKNGIIEISTSNYFIENNEYGLADGNYLFIKFSDNGSGIENSIQDKIFDPFFSTKTPDKGTGLGLSVSYGIIKRHNGLIKVFSESGKGTVFHILLPVSGKSGTKKITNSGIYFGKKEKILFIEDDMPLAEMQMERLELLGYEVTMFTNPVDALEKLPFDNFDLIISDYIMKEMNGIELISTLREKYKNMSSTPAIIISGLGELISGEDTKACGINMILTKPVSRNELAAAINEILA